MPRFQQHGPIQIKTFVKGANVDQEPEFIGASDGGQYFDARNMRPQSMEGHEGSIDKINGEELLYRNKNNICVNGNNLPLAGDWECIGITEINDYIVEIWADRKRNEPSLIRINGEIVLQSSDFPADVDHPFQIDTNDSCIGGEIYLTDYFNEPMLFNVEDLLKHAGLNGGITGNNDCDEKYFGDFNLEEHTLSLAAEANHPVFINLVGASTIPVGATVFGSGGLDTGQYQYLIRFVTDTGERTKFSTPTPPIPVIQRLDSASPSYPYAMTHGEAVGVNTSAGIHLKFRVNNENNYDFIEVARTEYNTGQILGSFSNVEIIGTIDIQPEEITVYDIVDIGATSIDTVPLEEVTTVLTAIKRAKAIRYFENRLYLMNVEYQSRNIQEIVDSFNVDLYPFIDKIGKAGYNAPVHHTYKKSYGRGERYGFGVVFYDQQLNPTFAGTLNGFDNYRFPNNREVLSAKSELISDTNWRGAPVAATTDTTVVGKTHEIFDLANAVRKSDLCSFKNIASAGQKAKGKLELGGLCPPVTGSNNEAATIGFKPLTPTIQSDPDWQGHEFRVNYGVGDGSGPTGAGFAQYFPEGFAPNYYAMGAAIEGLDNIPGWVSAFQVVRTRPAQRVFAQGIGFYSMNGEDNTFPLPSTSVFEKYKNQFWVHLPDADIDTGVKNVFEIIDNPARFKVQLVSPLGFFSEVFHFHSGATDTQIDMISYPRILSEQAGGNSINPGDGPWNVGVNGYVTFGKWRNPNASDGHYAKFKTGGPFNPSGAQEEDKFVFGISNAVMTSVSPDARGQFLALQLDQDVYGYDNTLGQVRFDKQPVKQWHEPVYLINIIEEDRLIPDQNITEYVDTGHFQKMQSTIGLSDGTAGQSFELVDERWEDCIPNELSTSPTPDQIERFIYIVLSDGTEQKWLNVTYLTGVTLTQTLNGILTGSHPSGAVGAYTHTSSPGLYNVAFSAPFNIVFDIVDNTFPQSLFIPPAGSKVIVKYDPSEPVKVFGGDKFVNENIFSPLDNRYNDDGDPFSPENQFSIPVGFPYHKYELNPKYYILNRASGAINRIQDQETCKFNIDAPVIGSPSGGLVRQLVVMFPCQTEVATHYAYNIFSNTSASSLAYFPLINYIMRPVQWNPGDVGGSHPNLQPDYLVAYPHEDEAWGWGGFRYKPQQNIDYSQNSALSPAVSAPKTGFTEETLFCSRVIWSEIRPINLQNAPGVRTFPALNFFDISDDTGEIKYAFDANGARGDNLYAFTEDGVALLQTNKISVYQANLDQLALLGAEGQGGVTDYIFLSRDKGMNDEMWRSAAEDDSTIYWANRNSVYVLSQDGIDDIGRRNYHNVLHDDILSKIQTGYRTHVTAVYDELHDEYLLHVDLSVRMREHIVNQGPSGTAIAASVDNIEKGDVVFLESDRPKPINIQVQLPTPLDTPEGDCFFLVVSDVFSLVALTYSSLLGNYQFNADPGACYRVCSVLVNGIAQWDFEEIDEVDCPQVRSTPAYSAENQSWNGRYDYFGDRFISYGGNADADPKLRLFVARSLTTYQIGNGYLIDGNPIISSVSSFSSEKQILSKEFIRIRIASDNKPTKVEFFDNVNQLRSVDIQSELDPVNNPLGLKDYGAYEQYIPRRTDGNRLRMQGRLLTYRIIHNLEEHFKIVDVGIQYKILK